MVVYTESSAGFRKAAARIADERGERLVEEFEEIGDAEPVVYVDDPTDIDEDVLLELQKRQLRNGPANGSFGVVTGFTPELAEQLYFRKDDASGEHVVLNGKGADEMSVADSRTTALGRDELSGASIEDVTEDRLSSLALNMGGSTIHLLFQDGFVCGVPETEYVEDYDGREPFCLEDGKRNCPYDDDLVRADHIDAANVFMNACSPVIANQSTGVAAHVGLNVLSRANSLIGPYRYNYLHDHELLLFHALLRSGYATDEITYVLNKNSHANDVMAYPYVLFGRPGTKLRSYTSPTYHCDGLDERGTLEITDIDAFVIDVTVPSSSIDSLDDRPYLYPLDGDEGRLNYSAFRENGDVRILLYADRRIQRDRLRLHVSGTPYRDNDRTVARRSIANARHNDRFSLTGESAAERATDLRNQVESLARNSVLERFRVDFPGQLDGRVDSVLGSVDGLNDAIVESLTDGSELTDKYAHAAVERNHSAPDETTCASCGTTLLLKEVSDPLDEERRLIGICPSQSTCGSRKKFDVPVHGDESTPSYPVIAGDLTNDDSDERTIEVTFQNPIDEPMRATFLPTVWRVGDAVEGEQLFEPRSVSTTLAPHETETVEFVLDDELLKPNEHYVQARVVGNAGIYSGLRPFFVGEKGSRQFRSET